ncbi:sensor domain-containing protein [Aurantiacibacter hainanensis]|uniref:sensor domain-containing protein n=1 Tax=Aurantiacibacter hainanensis TaxID=3076114 RepID=UPI0030C68A3F
MSAPLEAQAFWKGNAEPTIPSVDQPVWTADFLLSALAGAGVGTWQVDMKTGLATWDKITCTLLGLDDIEVGPGVPLPVHPGDYERIWSALNRTLATGEAYEEIFRGIKGDGTIVWLRGRGSAFPSGEGDPRFVAGVISDVTENVLATKSLEESERQFASIVGNLPGAAYRCETRSPWRMTFISDAVMDLTGYTPDEFVDGELTWDSIIEPAERDAIAERVAEALTRREKFELRYRIRHCSGELRWVHERGGAVYSDTGEPLFLEGYIGDVHEQAEAERGIREAEERFRLAAKATKDIIWDRDLATNVVQWDVEAGEALGFLPGEMSADLDWWIDRVHPSDRERVEAKLAEVTAGVQGRMTVEYRFRMANGNYAEILDRAFLIRDENDRPKRLVGAMHDQTESMTASRALAEKEARLQKIFDQAIVGIMEAGPGGAVELVNPRFCEILGRSAEELQSCKLEDYTHPDDLQWNRPLLDERLATGLPFRVEKRYVRPDGEVVWCNVSVSFILSEIGEVEKSIVVAEDITARKRNEAALSESEMLYRSVVQASTDCIKIVDLDGTVQFMNDPGLCAMEIEDADSVLGQRWQDLWPKTYSDTIDAALEAAVGRERVRFSGNCPTLRGEAKWWDVSVTPMTTEGGKVGRILAISRDVTEQRRTADELKWASEHDALTQLPNRRAFEARLRAATIRAMESGGCVGVLLLDLDHFKHVNDTMGHAAGDQLLTILSERLKKSIRSRDFAARLGGDEFAVILEGEGPSLDLKERGETILQSLRQPVRIEKRMVTAGGSIGGACFPADARNANELLKNADIALYALKATGRGGTMIFHQDMRDRAQIVSSQLTLARSAISQESVEPHYQQKVELATGRIAGFEALLRWRHVTRGLQLPDTVGEAFKDYELATRIGDLVQRQVLTDLRGWLDRNLPVGFVAINAAPAEFLRDDFAERLLAKIHEARVPASMIEIEVTEHVFFEGASQYVARALGELNQAGVRIALDDFGTGYSSLSHLRDFPVDVVKIDRSFVANMTQDTEMRAIVSAVIDLARSLKIDVVAEGVEDGAQFAALVEEGCLLGQGYYFGRAIGANDVSDLVGNSLSKPPWWAVIDLISE